VSVSEKPLAAGNPQDAAQIPTVMACEATPADSFSALPPPGAARNDLDARDMPFGRARLDVMAAFCRVAR
jgi:hypothetical protein